MNIYLVRRSFRNYCLEKCGAFYTRKADLLDKTASLSCYWSTVETDDIKITDVEDFLHLASDKQLIPFLERLASDVVDIGQIPIKLDPSTNQLRLYDSGKSETDVNNKYIQGTEPIQLGMHPQVEEVEDIHGQEMNVNDIVSIITNYVLDPSKTVDSSAPSSQIKKGVIRGWVLEKDPDLFDLEDELKKDNPNLYICNDYTPEQIEEMLSVELGGSYPETVSAVRLSVRKKIEELFTQHKLFVKRDTNGQLFWSLKEAPGYTAYLLPSEKLVDKTKKYLRIKETDILPYVHSNLLNTLVELNLKHKGITEPTPLATSIRKLSTEKEYSEEDYKKYIHALVEEETESDYMSPWDKSASPWAVVEILDNNNQPTGHLQAVIYYNLVKDDKEIPELISSEDDIKNRMLNPTLDSLRQLKPKQTVQEPVTKNNIPKKLSLEEQELVDLGLLNIDEPKSVQTEESRKELEAIKNNKSLSVPIPDYVEEDPLKEDLNLREQLKKNFNVQEAQLLDLYIKLASAIREGKDISSADIEQTDADVGELQDPPTEEDTLFFF